MDFYMNTKNNKLSSHFICNILTNNNYGLSKNKYYLTLDGGSDGIKSRYKVNFKTKHIIKHKKRYIKFSQNQLQILDALLNDGGSKKYIDSHNNLRFSEHSGLFDFDKTKLERVVISGKTNREDKDDIDILLPQNMIDALDYEYIFHTHPPTPYPGARAKVGILYEFPSISDLYHFAYHYNDGEVQGSMIISPEGIYIIRMKKDVKEIKYPPEDISEKLEKLNLKIQSKAIDKYGDDFAGDSGQSKYYNDVVQDKKYIKLFNRIVKKYFNPHMEVIYKPRKYDTKTKKWLFKKLLISVEPVEINYT